MRAKKKKKNIQSILEKNSTVPWLNEPHTSVRANRPGIVEEGFSINEIRKTIINPAQSFPLREGLRYVLTDVQLGKLECLARSRFEIRELHPNAEIKWKFSEGEYFPAIAQSVNASSAIEDEGIATEELPLLLTAATDNNGEYADDELQRRKAAIKSIYKAQLWALSHPSRDWISYEFVLELHKRMLEATTSRIAGRLKNEDVHIRGGGYEVETVPAKKTEEFLKALCDRVNRKFELAHKHAEASMFLTCAEFVIDFLAIHPFKDGNGRTARLLSTYLLERSGYHFARFYDLDSIILERRDEYYAALFSAQRNWYLENEDLTPWIEYYINAVFNQWERAYRRVREESFRMKRKR